MFAITYHGNHLWTLHYHNRQYHVSDILTAAAVLGVVHNAKLLKVLKVLFENPTVKTTLIVHPIIINRR